MTLAGRPIPMPWRVRLLQLRRRVAPGVLFAICLVATLWLWQRQRYHAAARGQVAAAQVVVSATSDGMLTLLPNQLDVFDPVLANATIVAQLDVTPVLTEIEILRTERSRLHAQLSAEKERLQLEQMRYALDTQRNNADVQRHIGQLRQEFVEFQLLRDQLTLNRIGLLSERAVANNEVKRLQDRIEHTRILVEKEMTSSFAVQDALNELAVQESRVSESQRALTAVEQQLTEAVASIAEARTRLETAIAEVEAPAEATSSQLRADEYVENLSAMLAPIERSIEVQELRIREVIERMERLEIRAPVTGTISAVHRQPGTWVQMGDPVLTIAENRPQHIVAFLPQGDRRRMDARTPVEILVGDEQKVRYAAEVRKVGAQYEMVPQQYLAPGAPVEWGLPVQISLPDGIQVRPGEFVEIVFPAANDDA